MKRFPLRLFEQLPGSVFCYVQALLRHIPVIWQASRPPFLLLPIVVVCLGAAASYYQLRHVSVLIFSLLVLLGVTSTVTVNLYNEFLDFKSLLDLNTKRTPFSGGSGALIIAPDRANIIFRAALITLFISVGLGLIICVLSSFYFLAITLVGLFLVWSYNHLWLKNAFLALLAPGLGFGLLMVAGSYFALTQHFSILSLLLASIVGCLVSGLLLLNQFPDAIADQIAGRQHFPLQVGLYRSAILFTTLYIVTFVLIGIGVWSRVLPVLCSMGLLTFPMAYKMLTSIFRVVDQRPAKQLSIAEEDMPEFLSAMQLNVVLNLLIPSLLILGFILSNVFALH